MPSIFPIPDRAIMRRIVSPPFTATYPEVWHPERIPSSVLRAVEHSWKRAYFPARQVTISLLEDVIVAAEGLVFTQTLDLLEPSITAHSVQQIECARTEVQASLKDGTLPILDGTIALCKKRGGHNYGHWLMEILPNAFLVYRYLGDSVRYIVQATGDQLGQVMKDSLSQFAISPDAIVAADDRPVAIKQLLFVDGLTTHGSYMSPLVMECIEALSSGIEADGPENLLVLRDGMPSRRFVNEAELRDLASRRGYCPVDTAGMSLLRQIACFKAAKRVVGVMGAAMANIAFSPLATNVINLAPASMADTFFWFISELRGLQYIEVRCEQSSPTRGPAPWDTDLILAPEDRDRIFSDTWPPRPRQHSTPENTTESEPMLTTPTADLSRKQAWKNLVRQVPDHTGLDYLVFLSKVHATCSPGTYLEIGTGSGDSLVIASCPSIAIDSNFLISADVLGKKPMCLMFQGASDSFFASHCPKNIFGKPIDFAFLDGPHFFEILLRDLINTERECAPNSMIAIHDCVPTDVYIADRNDDPARRLEAGSKPTWWTGDVWKIIPILKRWRPDLTVDCLDCEPTGLGLVTNLDPGSEVLLKNYEAIVEEFSRCDLAEYGLERFLMEAQPQSAASFELPIRDFRGSPHQP